MHALGRIAPLCHALALLGLCAIAPGSTFAAQPANERLSDALEIISIERILENIRTLSGPLFNGRQTGTEDDLRSAHWVVRELSSAGLHLPTVFNASTISPSFLENPAATRGLMATLVPTPVMSPDPELRIGTLDRMSAAMLGTDYLPIFDAPSADLHGRIVFAGYGIIDHTQGIDDYAGLDVNNSIVLFLRGQPEHVKRLISHADKVGFARKHGAIAYLTATGPLLHSYEARRGATGAPSAFYGHLPLDEAIPGAWISTTLAEQILADPNGLNPDRLRTLQEQLNRSPSTRSIPTSHYVSLKWKTLIHHGVMANALGVIPGTGSEWIIIGAHRDHFGRPAGLFFPGADDNASGTAVILEVARALMKAQFRPQRSVLFVSFSGEERNLLGSRLYLSRPLVPLSSTKAMVNIDHAGIGNGRLTIGITGIDKTVASDAGIAAGLRDKLDIFGYFPGGDHVPFKEAGVPTVTVVSSGIHPHFHQPTDTVETLDPQILKTAARYILALTWRLANDH